MLKLNDGNQIPEMGFGLYKSPQGKITQDSIAWAFEAGFRLFDTAEIYGNEADLGSFLHLNSALRKELYITTKVWNESQGYDKTLRAFDQSLKLLQTDYLDLYLIHWPVPETRKETWKALEQRDVAYKSKHWFQSRAKISAHRPRYYSGGLWSGE